MQKRDYWLILITVATLGVLTAAISIGARIFNWVGEDTSTAGASAGITAAGAAWYYHNFRPDYPKERKLTEPKQSSNYILFFLVASLAIALGCVAWGKPSSILIATMIPIGIVVGLLSGMWWYHFLNKNLKDGVYEADIISIPLWIAYVVAQLVLYYLIFATVYEAAAYWAMLSGIATYLVYLHFAFKRLKQESGKSIRIFYSNKYFWRMFVSYIVSMWFILFILSTRTGFPANRLE